MQADSALVLGAGSWGTALGLVLSRNQVRTYLWDGDRDHVQVLRDKRTNNRHLPGVAFPATLLPITELTEVTESTIPIIVVVPCDALRTVLAGLSASHLRPPSLCLACKGLEPRTLLLNHEVARDELGEIDVAVLSGPSFAAEVAARLPTAVTLASEQVTVAGFYAGLFHDDVFRTYTHNDVIGVQVGGAVKNVMAIAAGIADGLGFGANARAALITRGLAEIIRLGTAMGGKPETFMGLAGLGDLVLTCTDNQSRNRRFGLALAGGKSVQQAKEEIRQAVEGLRTAEVVNALAQKFAVNMPISAQVFAVIKGTVEPEQAVRNLLARERKAEMVF